MKCCETCAYHLGGGSCRLSLEDECGKGLFEAWEPEGFSCVIVEM